MVHCPLIPDDEDLKGIWNAVEELQTNVGELNKKADKTAEDLAYIRGMLEQKAKTDDKKDDRSFTWRHGIGMAIITTGISIVTAHVFKL